MKTVITSVISVVVVLVLVVVSVVKCGTSLFRVYEEFPEQANVEHLRGRFPQVVQDIESAIATTDSKLSLAAALEQISYPEEILFVAMQNYENDGNGEDEDNKGRLRIVDRMPKRDNNDSNLTMKMVSNGGGYGSTNDQHYWVLQQPLKKYNYEYIEIFIERPTPEEDSN